MDIALLHERRNDGMERPLAWRQRIWMLRLEIEQAAAVLQCEAIIVHYHARPEMLVQALNQRHDISVAVEGRQINRVPLTVGGTPGATAQLACCGLISLARSRA